jgi:hypothetical protein
MLGSQAPKTPPLRESRAQSPVALGVRGLGACCVCALTLQPYRLRTADWARIVVVGGEA